MAESDLPKGLLSFAYNVIYNKDVNNDFKKDSTKVFNQFGLSKEIQDAIDRAGNDQEVVPAHILAIMAYLYPELVANYDTTW